MLFGLAAITCLALAASPARAQPAAPSIGYNPYAGLGGTYNPYTGMGGSPMYRAAPYYSTPIYDPPSVGYQPYYTPSYSYRTYNYNGYQNYGGTYRNYSSGGYYGGWRR